MGEPKENSRIFDMFRACYSGLRYAIELSRFVYRLFMSVISDYRNLNVVDQGIAMQVFRIGDGITDPAITVFWISHLESLISNFPNLFFFSTNEMIFIPISEERSRDSVRQRSISDKSLSPVK